MYNKQEGQVGGTHKGRASGGEQGNVQMFQDSQVQCKDFEMVEKQNKHCEPVLVCCGYFFNTQKQLGSS